MRQPLLYGIPLLLASALALFSATDSDRALESPAVSLSNPDTDAYEDYARFFGLSLTNLAAEAHLDFDGDHLSNLQESESALLTDPFSPDTDCDLFFDNFDAVPISRVYLPFGVELFTHGDFCEYARPDWCLGAWKTGGAWFYTAEENGATNQSGFLSGWHVSSSETNCASLSLALDRAILTNNLEYALHYSGNSNFSLLVDLLAANGVVVAENLFGNLLSVSNTEAVVLLSIPTAIFPEAAIIRLRACHSRGGGNPDPSVSDGFPIPAFARTSGITGLNHDGEICIYEGLLYISEDGDALDSDQERQWGTSDYAIDSDGNGISDYAEWLSTGGNSTNNPDGGGGGGGDGGGGDSEDDHGSHTKQGIIYVDQSIGGDTLTGYSAEISGNEGPKKTVHGGLSVAETNDTLIIKSGHYNEDLNIQGKDVKVFIEGSVKL